MNDFEKYIHEVAQKLTITSSEKVVIRARLHAHMASHPLPEKSPYSNFLFFTHFHMIGATFLVLFFVTGGASAFAEKALPGDLLYSFKVDVNEEVRGWFSVSQFAKAEWSVRLAERRLLELESVEQDETISLAARQSLENSFAIQIKQANENTRAYEDKEQSYQKTEEQSDSLARENTSKQEVATSGGLSEALKDDISVASLSRAASSAEEKPLKIEEVRKRIANLKVSLREAKLVAFLDKGKVLRLEAKLVAVQRELYGFEKNELGNKDEALKSIHKIVIEIEEKLDTLKVEASAKIKASIEELLVAEAGEASKESDSIKVAKPSPAPTGVRASKEIEVNMPEKIESKRLDQASSIER